MTHIYDRTKNKTKDLILTLMTFWNFLASKCLLEKYSNLMGLLSPIRHSKGQKILKEKLHYHFSYLQGLNISELSKKNPAR